MHHIPFHHALPGFQTPCCMTKSVFSLFRKSQLLNQRSHTCFITIVWYPAFARLFDEIKISKETWELKTSFSFASIFFWATTELQMLHLRSSNSRCRCGAGWATSWSDSPLLPLAPQFHSLRSQRGPSTPQVEQGEGRWGSCGRAGCWVGLQGDRRSSRLQVDSCS